MDENERLSLLLALLVFWHSPFCVRVGSSTAIKGEFGVKFRQIKARISPKSLYCVGNGLTHRLKLFSPSFEDCCIGLEMD